VEDIPAVRPVRVRVRVPAGPGTRAVVHGHRAGAGRARRPHIVRGRVLLLGPVVRHHEDVQDVRRDQPGAAVVFVRRVLRRRRRLRGGMRAGDQQQEPRTDAIRHDWRRRAVAATRAASAELAVRFGA